MAALVAVLHSEQVGLVVIMVEREPLLPQPTTVGLVVALAQMLTERPGSKEWPTFSGSGDLMAIWAILDPTGTIINVVDDQDGKTPPLKYVSGQTKLDMKSLPDGVWAGWKMVDGQWIAPA